MRAIRRSVHPLLLEPTYWRQRLQALEMELAGPLITPRPDLSGNGRDVVEFRVRAHDGERLWGLLSRPEFTTGPLAATIRSVGPADPVAPSFAGSKPFGPGQDQPNRRRSEDPHLLADTNDADTDGPTASTDQDPTLTSTDEASETRPERSATPGQEVAEFIFQEPAGRRLEDRVLDVMRICKIACATSGVDELRVELSQDAGAPDEFLIVEHLKRGRLC
tara:strand:- start:5768 stop:6427 length:660 start_codon:yes stop_codon:yes gene_type:complete